MTTWHDIESARDQWVDAPLDDDLLQELLDVAQMQVIAYAPALPEGFNPETDLPANYRYGQIRQTENIWNAGRVDSSGGDGGGDFVIRPHPLDWHVQQILRPRRAVPRVR